MGGILKDRDDLARQIENETFQETARNNDVICTQGYYSFHIRIYPGNSNRLRETKIMALRALILDIENEIDIYKRELSTRSEE